MLHKYTVNDISFIIVYFVRLLLTILERLMPVPRNVRNTNFIRLLLYHVLL